MVRTFILMVIAGWLLILPFLQVQAADTAHRIIVLPLLHDNTFSPDAVATAPGGQRVAVMVTSWGEGKSINGKEHTDIYGVVQAWDVPDGRQLASFELEKNLTDIALAPGERMIALECSQPDAPGKFQYEIELRDLSGKLLGSLPPASPNERCAQLCFSPDGSLLARDEFAVENHVITTAAIRIWDVNGRQLKCVLPIEGSERVVRSLAFSPDTSRMAALVQQYRLNPPVTTLVEWDLHSSRPLRTAPLEGSGASDIAYATDGSLRIAGWQRIETARDKDLYRGYLWDAESGKIRCTLSREDAQSINALVFTPDGERLASAGDDLIVRVWDTRTGKLQREFSGHSEMIRMLAFLADGKTLVSTGMDDTLRIWNITGATPPPTRVLLGRGTCYSAMFSPDGKRILLDSDDDGLPLWDIARQEILRHFKSPIANEGRTNGAGAAAISASGHYTAGIMRIRVPNTTPAPAVQEEPSLSPDGSGRLELGIAFYSLPFDIQQVLNSKDYYQVVLWNSESGEAVKVFAPREIIGDLAFSPDDAYIAFFENFQTIRIYDVKHDSERLVPLQEDQYGSRLCFTDPSTFICQGADGRVLFINAATGTVTRTLTGITSNNLFTLAPDNDTLWTSTQEAVCAWDLRTGQQIRRYPMPNGQHTSLAVSPDGKLLIELRPRLGEESWDDPLFNCWDISGPQLRLLATIDDPGLRVTPFVLSPDGNTLATGWGQSIRLWDLSRVREGIVH